LSVVSNVFLVLLREMHQYIILNNVNTNLGKHYKI